MIRRRLFASWRKPTIVKEGNNLDDRAQVGQRPIAHSKPPPLASLATTLARCFVDCDALTLELYPVALDSQDRWTALDAHLELDDDAAYRQQELLTQLPLSTKLSDTRSEFEREAAKPTGGGHPE